MASGFPPSVIRCRVCSTQEVRVAGPIRHDAVVSCSHCGTALWTWLEFLARISAAAEGPAIRQETSGLRAFRDFQEPGGTD